MLTFASESDRKGREERELRSHADRLLDFKILLRDDQKFKILESCVVEEEEEEELHSPAFVSSR